MVEMKAPETAPIIKEKTVIETRSSARVNPFFCCSFLLFNLFIINLNTNEKTNDKEFPGH